MSNANDAVRADLTDLKAAANEGSEQIADDLKKVVGQAINDPSGGATESAGQFWVVQCLDH